jgi:hypothetical protein
MRALTYASCQESGKRRSPYLWITCGVSQNFSHAKNTLAIAISIRTVGAAMNWSMFTADRATHLKIVAVGLCATLLIAVIRISVGG